MYMMYTSLFYRHSYNIYPSAIPVTTIWDPFGTKVSNFSHNVYIFYLKTSGLVLPKGLLLHTSFPISSQNTNNYK